MTALEAECERLVALGATRLERFEPDAADERRPHRHAGPRGQRVLPRLSRAVWASRFVMQDPEGPTDGSPTGGCRTAHGPSWCCAGQRALAVELCGGSASVARLGSSRAHGADPHPGRTRPAKRRRPREYGVHREAGRTWVHAGPGGGRLRLSRPVWMARSGWGGRGEPGAAARPPSALVRARRHLQRWATPRPLGGGGARGDPAQPLRGPPGGQMPASRLEGPTARAEVQSLGSSGRPPLFESCALPSASHRIGAPRPTVWTDFLESGSNVHRLAVLACWAARWLVLDLSAAIRAPPPMSGGHIVMQDPGRQRVSASTQGGVPPLIGPSPRDVPRPQPGTPRTGP